MSFPYNIRIPLQKSKYKSDYKKRYKGVTESVEEEYTEFEKVDATVRPVISNSHRARKKRSMRDRTMETCEEQGGEPKPQSDTPAKTPLASKELSRESTLPLSRETTLPLSQEAALSPSRETTLPLLRETTPQLSRETAQPSRETVDDQPLDSNEAVTQHDDVKAKAGAVSKYVCTPSKEQESGSQEGIEQNGRKPGEEKPKNMIFV